MFKNNFYLKGWYVHQPFKFYNLKKIVILFDVLISVADIQDYKI